MSNSRECKYSWVGSNSRVINYLSLARPFPSPSPFKWQRSSSRQCPVASISPNSTQIQSNPFISHSKQLTPLENPTEQTINIVSQTLLTSVQPLPIRYNSYNFGLNQQWPPHPTHQTTRCYQIHAQFINWSSTTVNSSSIINPPLKFLPAPTKLRSYCYCSPSLLSG